MNVSETLKHIKDSKKRKLSNQYKEFIKVIDNIETKYIKKSLDQKLKDINNFDYKN